MENNLKFAYLAGLLDGEGHLSILLDKGADRGHVRHFAMVGIVNTDMKMINWLQDNFGGRIYHWNGKSKKPHWKEKYEWRIYSYAMTDLIEKVSPFLIVKKEQAEILLAFRKTFQKGKAFRGEEIFKERENFFFRMQSVNHRGQSL